MEKLSSGFRINRAGDDAAGLAISEKMRGQIRGLKQASRNAQDGISLIQTAEGALNETHAILQRMRELAVQASTDTNTPEDRNEIQKEINQLSKEVNRIADTTQFNTMELLNGTYEGKFFHIGANQGQNLDLEIADMSADALKVGTSTVTEETGVDVLGVASQKALMAGDRIVAVEVDSEWYSIDDVAAVGGAIVVKDGAEALETTAGKAIDGIGFYQEGKAQVAGVADTDVLVDADSNVMAVKVGEAYYAESDVENDSGSIKAKSDVVALDVTDVHAIGDGKDGIDVSSSRAAADAAIKTIDDAIVTVSGERSKLGAIQNRLEHTIANLGTSAENLQAAESRIRDLDMAEEIMAFTKNNILQQAATAMLAQANMAPQSVLQLLG